MNVATGTLLVVNGLWLWVALALSIVVIWLILRPRRSPAPPPEEPRMLLPDEQPAIIKEVMKVRIATEEDGVQMFRGRLQEPASEVFAKVKEAFAGRALPLIQEDERLGASIMLLPQPATADKPIQLWRHWLLFGLTVLTTTWAGALHQGINLLAEPHRFSAGLPYSLGLLAILGFHELGHYFTARRHRMHVTPPYFIPVPFALGTFGAFIQMRSPPESRRVLFDVAIAGPLAGLIVAIPALYFGLQQSLVLQIEAPIPVSFFSGASPNASILMALIAKASINIDLAASHLVQLSPLAFAGWLGLLVTALNLLPIGQLDGGHITRGMFGSRIGFSIGRFAMIALFITALFIPQLMLWAAIVFFIAGEGSPPLNDITPVSPGRRALGAFAFVILGLIVIPLPPAWWVALRAVFPF